MTQTGPGADPPNPFSREGSQAADGIGAQPSSTPSAEPEPFDPYPPPPADPYPGPGAYSGPFQAQQYPTSGSTPGGPPPPGFDPQPTPPYGSGATASPYDAPMTPYGSNPYEYTPYQAAYGGPTPYGVVQVNHPKATSAMVFGILGIALGLSCGLGGLLGIPGIVQGRRARDEIDAQPGRYGGRSQAVAGVVTGIIGVVIAALVIVLVVVVILLGVSGQI
jgi:uncharacterized protein DUF4190